MKKETLLTSIIVFIIIATSIFGAFNYEKQPVINLLNLILVAGLAGVTAVYAYYTQKMAEEMKKQRHEAFRPIIDIVAQPLNPVELAKQAYTIREGKLPEEIPCILRNIGVGPAVDLHSFVQYPNRFDFGTLAKGDSTPKINLKLIQKDNNMILVAFYYDVYCNLLASSRKVTINKNNNITLDHLSIEPVRFVEESDIP